MKDFSGRVAVVTGAASGIGRALVKRFAAAGMKVVLADVEEEPLQDAAQELTASGAEALAVRTDVARESEVRALADATLDAFGAVHIVCNNAGVITAGLAWESPHEDYEWLIDVNLWGVIHGVRVFTPIMLGQNTEGHIVNTASMAAVTSSPFASIYYMTKHAVLGYSESLYHDLASKEAKVGVSVLCPELINTNIGDAERNRPKGLAGFDFSSVERETVVGTLRELARSQGLAPTAIADRVLDAITKNQFYILSDDGDGWRRSCETRLEDIRLARNPTFDVPNA